MAKLQVASFHVLRGAAGRCKAVRYAVVYTYFVASFCFWHTVVLAEHIDQQAEGCVDGTCSNGKTAADSEHDHADSCSADGACIDPIDQVEEVIDLDALPEQALIAVPKKAKKAGKDGDVVLAAQIISPFKAETADALKNELVAAEAALAMRVEVDGPHAVYESPSMTIALRKVSQEVMQNEWVELKGVDGASVTIPPGAKQMHGGPVTIMLTSYHNRKIKKKHALKATHFGKSRKLRRKLAANEELQGKEVQEDRVDFFLDKEKNETDRTQPDRRSVSWSGTVDVRKRNAKGYGKDVRNGMDHGLAMSVPVADYDFAGQHGKQDDVPYAAEKQQLQLEMEALVKLPPVEQDRAFRKLAKRWHPDLNPKDRERATELFSFLSETREEILS